MDATNWTPMVDKCQEKGVGLISANWTPHSAWVKRRPIKDKFVKWPLVYTGGGLVFNNAVADIIRRIPYMRFWSDNVQWALRFADVAPACTGVRNLEAVQATRYRIAPRHCLCRSVGKNDAVVAIDDDNRIWEGIDHGLKEMRRSPVGAVSRSLAVGYMGLFDVSRLCHIFTRLLHERRILSIVDRWRQRHPTTAQWISQPTTRAR